MTSKLYVGNLPGSATETDLQSKFARSGRVLSVVIEVDAATGRNKRFGYVEMETETDAQAAVCQLNMTQYDDMVISVNRFRIKVGQ